MPRLITQTVSGDGLGLVLEAEAFGIPEVPVTAAPETANDGTCIRHHKRRLTF